MKIDVVLYNTKIGQKQNLDELCPRGIQLPIGFTLSGGQRKFIVLLSNEARDRDNLSVVIAIGELLQNQYYYHKEIFGCGKKEFSECSISGGGQVDFELHASNPYWHAKFSGQSGDYGVFDQVLVETEVVNAMAKAMKMNIRVEMPISATARF